MTLKRKTPIKRSSKPIKRTAVKKARSKPRPGRLKGDDLKMLRLACYDRDRGRCVACWVLVDPRLSPEADKSFHMAHRRGKRNFGDHIDQVETNCGACHRKFHNYGPSMQKPCPKKVQ